MICDTEHEPFSCLDCAACTLCLHEYYMVHDSVWDSIADRGMLCIGCLEQRLGREVSGADFTLVPLNLEKVMTGSERLKARFDLML